MDLLAVDCEEILRSKGLRCTVNRARVLEVFWQQPGNGLTNEDVYRALLKRGTPMPLGSVCRTVPELEEAGLLRCLNPEGTRRRGIYQAVPAQA